MMMLTRFLFFVTCLSVCHSKRNFGKNVFSTLKCAGPKHLDALGCAFKSPYGKVYQLNKKSISYEDDTIHCLCKTQDYDPKKLCGILIENVQEKHVGKWECMLTYNINGNNVTAKGSTYLKIKQDYATSTESNEESEEESGEEPTTKDTTTIRSTIEYTTKQRPTTQVPSERPMLELKTATEKWAQSDGDFRYKFISSDGSCEISILDNPGDDMALGAIDRYTGDQLESCSDFEADDITSVVIKHDRGDGWMGEYLKMYLDDKVFICPLGKWVEKDSPEVEFPCYQGPMLELKTATEKWAQSDGDFHYKFLSTDGSCEISILDNPGDDMALGAIDRYTGDQLESCSDFEADDITSVVITHDRGDGWMGEYLKLYLGDKVFYCTLGKWVEKDSPKVEFPCSQ